MKKLATALSVFAVAAVVSGSSAFAVERVNSLDLSGSQVKEIIQEKGSVILSTGADLYDRYVANEAYCSMGEQAEAAYVPTASSSSEFVGYTCEPVQDNS